MINIQSKFPIARYTLESAVVIAGAALSAYLFFWPEFLNGFTRIYGDAFDPTIEAVIISHWHWVLLGLQKWNQTPYYFPHTDTLGYNDSLFLFGMIASVFRALGADVFRAMEFTHIAVKLIGFFSMYALLRRIDNRPLINVALAVVFTIALNSETGQHLQLLALSFSPAMVLLGIYALSALEKEQITRCAVLSVSWAILFGAWLLTGYYMAFFFGLFLVFFAIAYIVSAPGSARQYVRLIKGHPYVVLLFVLALVIAVAPFLAVYLPKLKETGGQPIELAKANTQFPIDLLNIGAGSALWGNLYTFINHSTNPPVFRPGEHMTGFQPIFFVIFFIAGGALFVSRRSSIRADKIMLAMFWASLAVMVCVLDVYGKSIWVAIYRVVPGAKGVRIIARYFMFLMFPMSLVVAYWLHRVSRSSAALVSVVLVLLIVEQINLTPRVEFDLAPQIAVLDRIPPAPSECKVFYGTNPTEYVSWDPYFTALYGNVQSMLVADHLNLPTVNGVTAIFPSDWIFNGWPAETYVQRATQFAKENNIADLCAYDIKNGKWSR